MQQTITKTQIKLIFFSVFIFIFLNKNAIAQTTLERGDLAVVGVNASNANCSGISTEDLISFVCFKPILSGTVIDMTDNGWERLNPNLFGDTEGTVRTTYTGPTIPAGQVITFSAVNTPETYACITHTGWSFVNINPVGFAMNMNFMGDQLYFMQDGTWDVGSPAPATHDASYSGRILFGFNTRPVWAANGTSSQSNLHPEVTPCFHMEPSNGQTDFLKYTGPMTSATQLEWIERIGDANNWTSYPDCGAYNTGAPDYADANNLVNLPIASSGMSVDCTVCNGSCGVVNETLVFTLPAFGGPFNVVYTDGTNDFTLNGITNGHTENVAVAQSTTFELVSVTDINGCPIFSNFDDVAVVTISGSGGMASISGGGSVCPGECTNVNILITGGVAPYTINGTVSFPPIPPLNIPMVAPNTNFTITVCVQNIVFPNFDPNTNTLNIPESLTNGTITLISMTDNTGCNGTVDPTPLSMTIETPPSAFPASMSACDTGNGMAIFDLTSLNSTINGNTGHSVDWFLDMNTTMGIISPSAHSSSTATVYAVVNDGTCLSEVIAVPLTVSPAPTANATSMQQCATAGNQATFDLTSNNNIINGNSGLPVAWYQDVNTNILIPNPSNFTTGTTSVYAVVEDNGCFSQPVEIMLTVNPSPAANTAFDVECELVNGVALFDLNSLENTVNTTPGNTVSWFSDPNANNPIASPYSTGSTTIYAVVSNGICSSSPTAVTLTVIPMPPANTTSAIECDSGNGTASFDLNSLNNTINGNSGNAVSWFSDMNANNPIPSPYTTGSTTVYAVVSNGTCSSNPVPIILTVNPAPTANTTTASECDSGNGTASFDLTSMNSTVNGNTGIPVFWYQDPNATIAAPSPFTTASTTVYAVVTNGICSSAPTPVVLTVETTPTANTTSATECDIGNGTATFDLTALENTINANQGNPVNWYLDPSATIPIASPYNTASTAIFAVVTNGTCSSAPVAIILNVENAPTANPTSDTECDSGNGTATFDLNSLNNIVNGNSGNTVTWYANSNGTSPLPSPLNTPSITVYAVVDDGGSCPSAPVAVVLTVAPVPTANGTSATECDSGNGTANFDLTALENTVNGNSGNTVTWYADPNATVVINSPYSTPSTSVYAVVSDGSNCNSAPVEVMLTVENALTANPTSDTECDSGNGTASFDLTVLENTVNGNSGNTVTWYADPSATVVINSPYSTPSTIIYAVVSDGGNCVSAPTPIVLTVENLPQANPTSDTECDSGNGTASFDLTTLENTVNGNTTNTVTWYADANAITEINSPYSTPSTTVYAVVSDGGNCNSVVVPIILTVENLPQANPTSTSLCDEGNGNGTATFDLTTLNNTINGNSGNQVDFFLDQNGALPIATNFYTTFNTVTATIYAQVTDGNCISNFVPIDLNVITIEANSTTDSQCDEGNGTANFDLNILETTINGGNGNTVNWYDDPNGNNPITSPYTSGNATIYAQVTDGNCVSETVEITLEVTTNISANPTSDTQCDEGNGMATFDLNILGNTVNGGNGNTVNWFDDVNGNNPIASPYNSGNATIYAQVSDGNCVSDIVEVTLEVTPSIAASPASDSQCDEGNGMASFDLTALENVVNSGNGNTVLWFDDLNGNNPITSPYTSGTATIYAQVTDGNCLSDIVEISLEVASQIAANPTSDSQCDEGNGTAIFDLTALENIVNGGNGNTVNWYDDANANNPITSPYTSGTTSIFAQVVDGNCVSNIVEISLEVTGQLNATPTSAAQCNEGNGIATFDLTPLENAINGGNGNTVLWFDDPNGNNPITSPYVTVSTTVYAQVVDGNCSSDLVEVILVVSNLINANSTSDSQCDEGNGTAIFDLTTLENAVNGGNGNTVNWYSDPNINNAITSPYTSAATTIYAQVVDGNCISAIVDISLDVIPPVEANPTSDSQCDEGNGTATFDLNSLENTVNGGNGNTVNWFDDANANNPITSPFNSATTSIFAQVTDGNCLSDIVEISLEVSNQVTANPTSDSQCDDGNGTATFDLNSLENTVNGGNGNIVNWYDDANANNPITSPYTSGTTSIFAQVVDGNCVSNIVEISLEVTGQLNATPTSAAQCNEGNGIATFDLTPLENAINGGNGNTVLWFDDPNGNNPITSPYVTVSTTVYAQVVDGNCSSDLVEVILVVSNLINANSTSDSQCDEGNGTAIFDLTTLENAVNGGNGNTVNWYSDPNINNAITSPYTSAATTIYAQVVDGNCISAIVDISLDVIPPVEANPTSDSQCDEGNGTATFDLNSLENTVNGGNGNTVNWFDDANANNPITSPFNSATTSIFAQVTDGNCLSDIVEISLEVSNQVTANPTSDSQCDDGNGTATFDLNSLENTVNGGNGNIVNWYDDANANNPITSPYISGTATIYAQVSDGNCLSEVVEISLEVSNQIVANPTADFLCDDGSGTGSFDLSVLENAVNGGSSNTVNWYADVNTNNPITSPYISPSTTVYAQVSDGNCTSDIVEVILEVGPVVAAFPTSFAECDEGNGAASFQLTQLESTVNGGTGNTVNWYADANTNNPITSPFSTVTSSVFAVVTDGNCFSNTVEISLQVVANSTNDITQTLCAGQSISVNNIIYNENNPIGTEIISGGNINGCDSIINVDLSFEPEITGSISASATDICPGSPATLTFSLSPNGIFDIEYGDGINPPTLLTGINDGHIVTVFPTATTTYSLLNILSQNSNCPGNITLSQVTVNVTTNQVQATIDTDFDGFAVSCFGENDGAATATPLSGNAPFTFQWSNGSTATTISNITAGSYTVTATDSEGCTAEATINLTQPSEIQLVTATQAPACDDINNGSVLLESLSGGTAPYQFSLDGTFFNDIPSTPFTIGFVPPGNYNFTIADANDCLVSENIFVPESINLTVDLGDDETIELGDSIELQADANFIPAEIFWSENIDCSNCLSEMVTPTQQTTYIVTLIDENGCEASDTITIFVEKNRHVYIPNAFSPNEDGINEFFYINAGSDVAEVKTFQIFNRWGELIFSKENFQPNDPTEGWDGFFKNQKLNPGVFVYFAEIEFVDGLIEIYKGDVSLTH